MGTADDTTAPSPLPSRREFLLGSSLAAAGLAATPARAQQAPTAPRAPIVLKYSFLVGLDSAFGRAYQEWARLVSERTNNQVAIQLFPNGQLGGDLEVIEQIRLGAPLMTLGYDAALEQHIPDFGMFSAPYVFPNWAAAQRVFNSDLYQSVAQQTYSRAGLIFENRNWRTGYRHWINRVRPFVTPADMKGVKLRSQQAPVYLAMMKTLGAIPVPIAVPELYTAVQQGVVDGASSVMAGLRAWKLYEVCKFFSLTHHVLVAGGLFAGKFFAGLPKDIQQIVIAANREAGELHNRLQEQGEADDRRLMESQGVKFNDIEFPAWQKAVEPVYAEFKSKWTPGLLDKIRALAG